MQEKFKCMIQKRGGAVSSQGGTGNRNERKTESMRWAWGKWFWTGSVRREKRVGFLKPI